MMNENISIAIIGLGYVGLPLAVAFGNKFNTIGFDINDTRIKQLQNGKDSTFEVKDSELKQAEKLKFTSNSAELSDCNIYIVAVPTPVDEYKRPDLELLEKASVIVGKLLNPEDIVIYESTVFPGATEEICVPILEKESGLKFNQHFFVGYSPERINPGDQEHRLATIVKVTSGSTPKIADFIDELYGRIIEAGTHKASSIKVAEAAKVIENTQRDINIALINELAIFFNRLNIDTEEVLKAAESKWNFLPFRPGLVGGHCIGVDPYYLTHKASEIGYYPQIILSGRRINDGMGEYVADRVIELMTKNRIQIVGSNVLVLGLTFKEDCPDIRNTRSIDIIKKLENYSCNVSVFDPWVDKEEVFKEYGLTPINSPEELKYDAIILAVGHRQFKEMGGKTIHNFGKQNHILFDVKYVLPADQSDARL
ncbi:MAG: Vi polysaccharide biosynthesis UDP-N-acetylglucosamine C-6 dehydrogenase TviB [Rhodospirillales bacterium]|nr:Vi polysaccharide biosynthesis UDP-N-acetylglucosamine C-6 dehydrogenase TviB [Rhodospirillales bacterium]